MLTKYLAELKFWLKLYKEGDTCLEDPHLLAFLSSLSKDLLERKMFQSKLLGNNKHTFSVMYSF
jgi:hypothetical protein